MSNYLDSIKQYALLMRLHRPIGIFLLLWPTLWALWVAGNGKPDLKILVIFVLGVIIMRSAGCIINDITDRNFDGKVQRTKERPLVTKKVTIKEALLSFLFLSLFAFALVLFLNSLTIWLAVAGMLVIIVYPFMKRITHLPQLVLGIAFAWGVPMAFAAQTNTLPVIGWLIFVIAAVWIILYDTQYAMVDKIYDLQIGVKSTAILFGEYDRLIVGILQIIMLALLFLLSKILSLNYWFNLVIIIVAGFFIYQQYLIRARDPQRCFQAFLNNNWVGLIIFVGLILNFNLR